MVVLGESNFWFRFRFIVDHNGKNWKTERKRNQKLLSPSTIVVIVDGEQETEPELNQPG